MHEYIYLCGHACTLCELFLYSTFVHKFQRHILQLKHNMNRKLSTKSLLHEIDLGEPLNQAEEELFWGRNRLSSLSHCSSPDEGDRICP